MHTVDVYTLWETHKLVNCSICHHHEQVKKGGHPQKKQIGRLAKQMNYVALIRQTQSIAPQSFWPQLKLQYMKPNQQSSAIPLCSICLEVPDKPVELVPCNSVVCCTCLCTHLEITRGLSCLCCYDSHLTQFSTVRAVSSLVHDAIGNVNHQCPICNETVVLKNVLHHHETSCKSSGTLSIEHILSSPITQPLSTTECQITQSLVKRGTADGGLLQVGTPRQVSYDG